MQVGRQQAGREEREKRHAAGQRARRRVDERADADAHRQQEQRRLQKAQ